MAVCGDAFLEQPLELRYARGIGAGDQFSGACCSIQLETLSAVAREWLPMAGPRWKKTPFPGMVAGGDLPAGGSGPDSREISRRLLAGGKVMEWVTLGEFSSVHLIRSIMQGRG